MMKQLVTRLLGHLVRRSRLYKLIPLKLNRRIELQVEIAFWDRWIQTGGSKWPAGFTARLDPNSELQPELRRCIDPPEGRPIEILDVASGPMTWVGKRWDSHEIRITAVDLLAPCYNKLLKKNRIEPLVRTRYATVEDLTKYVPSDYYDLVFIKNALDHSIDPVRGIREMLKAARPGCKILLRHHRNESTRHRGGQLHNWDFDLDSDGRFTIRTSGGRLIRVEELLSHNSEFNSELIEGDSPFGDILTQIRRVE